MGASQRRDQFRAVYEHFADLIDSGCMKPGDRLPARPDIAKCWNISPATATKAVDALREDLYVRANRDGTFVYLAGPTRLYRHLLDVLNQLEGMGQDPHVMVSEGGIPLIYGRDGGVTWNPEAECWETQAA